MMSVKQKSEIIATHRRAPSDTGSSEVQIALLSANIKSLELHMKNHPHDFHSRRGLLKQVSLRRRLLNYLKKREPQRYSAILTSLNLRR